jgi:hypothetical protein
MYRSLFVTVIYHLYTCLCILTPSLLMLALDYIYVVLVRQFKALVILMIFAMLPHLRKLYDYLVFNP